MGLRQLVQFDEPKDALPRYLKAQKRILGGGFVMVITGGRKKKMRTGKSWTAARIGEVLVPHFSVDRIVALPINFLEQQAEIEKKAAELDVLIMDEGGVAVSSKQWMNLFNQLIGYSVQIAGDLNCIIIIVAPNFSLIDKSIRMLVAYWGYCVKKRGEDGKTNVYFYLYETNTDLLTGNVYFSKLRFYDRKNKHVVVAKNFRVNKINEKLAEAYVKKSSGYKQQWREEFLERAESFQKTQTGIMNKFNYNTFANEAMQNEEIKKAIGTTGRVTDGGIMTAFPNLNLNQAKTVKKIINFMSQDKRVHKIE